MPQPLDHPGIDQWPASVQPRAGHQHEIPSGHIRQPSKITQPQPLRADDPGLDPDELDPVAPTVRGSGIENLHRPSQVQKIHSRLHNHDNPTIHPTEPTRPHPSHIRPQPVGSRTDQALRHTHSPVHAGPPARSSSRNRGTVTAFVRCGKPRSRVLVWGDRLGVTAWMGCFLGERW
nr:hypothetical protein GCM10017745_39450 [Saccharothrix mutabilis subsp. capreolus]